MHWSGSFTLFSPPQTFANTLTKEGVRYVVESIAGTVPATAAAFIYLRFGTPLSDINGYAGGVSVTADMFHKQVGGTGGVLYVPIIPGAELSTTDVATYAVNQALFRYSVAVNDYIGKATSASNDSFYDGGSIYAMGLVTAPDFTSRRTDVLLAVSELSTPIELWQNTIVPGSYTFSLTV